MTTVVKNKTPITIPPSIQRLAVSDKEYTAEQRQQIDAELAEASKGPYFGPFETADGAIAFMTLEIRKRRGQKRPSAKNEGRVFQQCN